MYVRRLVVVAALVCLATAAALVRLESSSGAGSAEPAASGKFSLIMMVHTLGSVPEYTVPATTPWSGALQPGASFSYRSIPCTGNAPVNNIASDLPSYNTRVAGSRAPSSMRAHPFEFRLVRVPVKKGSKRKVWEMQGRITFTVCKLAGGPTPNPDPIPDADKPKIFMTFRARFTRVTAESMQWAGTVKLVGGTQRYEGLKGSATVGGYFFCFAAEGCAAKGAYQDGQMSMHGTYVDPTPQLSG